jgi:putative ABC transport system permease protein
MTLFNDIAVAVRIAARDMRGGARGLWLLVGGVFIGAVAVALVGTTSQSLIDGARRGALESVGGDLSLRLFHRPPRAAELAVIRPEGEISITAELRPMARAAGSGGADGAPVLPVLVELKGVDEQYPLYGAVEIQPAFNLHQTLDRQDGVYGAVADRALFDALGLEAGDHLRIGDVRYQLRGELVVEPDRAFRAFTLGPRIMVSNESLPATGVANEGAEIYYYTRVKLAAQSDQRSIAKAALARIDRSFPQSGWRMVNAHNGVPGVERTLVMAQVLALFIGLGVMLIGGAGISGAVRAHVAEKMVTIAILKSIGAPPRVVTMAIGAEIMAAAFVGAFFGVALGAFGPVMASGLMGELPFTPDVLPDAKPLLATGLFSILVTALFAWWPLMGVQDMSARVLLRQRITRPPGKLDVNGWFGAAIIIAALIAVVFWVSPMPALTVGFLGVALLLSAFYYGFGIALARLAKVLARGKGANFRLALGNLYRTGAPTGPVVLALGLTLTLLVALEGVGSAASRHVQKTLPLTAPDLVAFSINPEMAKRLGTELAASGWLERQRIMPFLHARVEAIGGVAVRDLELPGSLNWVIRGDRGVSFAATLPDGARWDKTQLDGPGFSMDAGVAKKLGIGIGDTITLNVGGQTRTGLVLNFRNVDWTGLDLDFPIIATPNTFGDIPFTFAASLKAKQGREAALEVFIKQHFPNIPLVRVADVMGSLAEALNAVLTGLQAATMMCGLAALVVLAGSVLQGLRERTDEAILFKVLGARKRQLLGQLAIEFLGLGTLVAVAAVPMGLGIAYGIAHMAGLGSVSVSWGNGVALAVVAIFITLVVGLLATLGAYTAAPARILRNRSL